MLGINGCIRYMVPGIVECNRISQGLLERPLVLSELDFTNTFATLDDDMLEVTDLIIVCHVRLKTWTMTPLLISLGCLKVWQFISEMNSWALLLCDLGEEE